VVFLLTIFSLRLYWPVWFGQTWSELKRVVRDPGMNPVAHALSLFVPIYGLFRIGAHFRVMHEQRVIRGLRSGILGQSESLWVLFAMWFVIYGLATAGY